MTMESTIKWQKGKPKERGSYIVSLKNGKVDFDNYDGIVEDYLLWFGHKQEEVVAWCKLSDIEPYSGKEE